MTITLENKADYYYYKTIFSSSSAGWSPYASQTLPRSG